MHDTRPVVWAIVGGESRVDRMRFKQGKAMAREPCKTGASKLLDNKKNQNRHIYPAFRRVNYCLCQRISSANCFTSPLACFYEIFAALASRLEGTYMRQNQVKKTKP
ncbi:hypothetical protein PoB_007570700 [Plakobranchus ocellatus]|uniref:Uncharacterized protein n=1 Tax=Plakobranchus ocellatus TaxID=259542 RepID=A0AAV4DXX9_9GAST|nr:hypothetical protein PoB_007570700 [Plakobranchus ocellatus]